MIVAVPADTPVIAPDAEIVATDGVLLVHDVPGVVGSDTNVTEPVHAFRLPFIGAGVGFTVMLSTFRQPSLIV